MVKENFVKEKLVIQMLEAGLHFGHQKAKKHPKMNPYIFTFRNGVAILDLQKTQDYLARALDFVENVVKQGGQILFLGSKKQAQDIIQETAEKAAMPYLKKRWLGGLFTNFDIIKKNIIRLKTLEQEEKRGGLDKYTKKEKLLLLREKARLEATVGGLKNLDSLPQAIFIVDVVKEKNAVQEARRKKIPIIALVDTNGNPALVDYPIPGNDDAIRGIRLICEQISEAVIKVRNK